MPHPLPPNKTPNPKVRIALGEDPLYVALPRLLVPPSSWEGGETPLQGEMGDNFASYDSLDKWLGSDTAAAGVHMSAEDVEAMATEWGDVTEMTEWGAVYCPAEHVGPIEVSDGSVQWMWGQGHRDQTCVA